MTIALIPIILRFWLRWREAKPQPMTRNISDGLIVLSWLSGLVLISSKYFSSCYVFEASYTFALFTNTFKMPLADPEYRSQRMEEQPTTAVRSLSAKRAVLRRPAPLVCPSSLRVVDLALLHLHLAMGRQICPYRLLRERDAVNGDSLGATIRWLRHLFHHEHLRLTHSLAG